MGKYKKTITTKSAAGIPLWPESGVEDLLAEQKALILAPYVDDERPGCSDLIAAACAAGRPPFVVVMTADAPFDPRSTGWSAARPSAMGEAALGSAIGLPPEHLFWLGYRDICLPNAGPDFEGAVRRVELIAAETGCTLLLSPRQSDPHRDNHATARIAAAAASRGRLTLRSYRVGMGGGGRSATTSPGGLCLPSRLLASRNAG